MLTLRGHGESLGRGERGGVYVLVAVWMPLAVLMAAFVIDFAKWFEDKRHLQMQVDAAALAGAGSYRLPCDGTVESNIENAVLKYSGDLNRDPTAYNRQVSDATSVHALINSTNYWSTGSDFSDTGKPCIAGFVDVKATHASPSFFFGSIVPSGVLPKITAHARVVIVQSTQLAPSLPLAVPDATPSDAMALFVDESQPVTAAPLKVETLTEKGQTTMNGRTLDQWNNLDVSAGDPNLDVNINARDIGVVIALSGAANPTRTGSLQSICTQPRMECFYADNPSAPTSWKGLTYIRGYDTGSAGGSPTAPVATDVSLSTVGSTCSDASAPSFVLNTGCQVKVKAKIDFGSNPNPPGAVVKVADSGNNFSCPNSGQPKGCAMAYQTTGADAGYWTTTQNLNVLTAQGPLPVSLNWQTTASGNSTTPMSSVQRIFTAPSDQSDPIQYAKVFDASTGTGVNSLSYGTHSLQVSIGIYGALKNSSATALLRLADGSGSHTHAIDCNGQGPISNAVLNGCTQSYQLNLAPPTCHTVTPPDCAAQKTGQVSSLMNAVNDRFVTGGTCAPNKWSLGTQALNPSDPRLVWLVVTSFGAFDGNGASPVPVIGFATFYITGWDGAKSQCTQSNDPYRNEDFPYPNACVHNNQCQAGDIWGHFFKYAGPIPGSTGGGGCDPSALAPCTLFMSE